MKGEIITNQHTSDLKLYFNYKTITRKPFYGFTLVYRVIKKRKCYKIYLF